MMKELFIRVSFAILEQGKSSVEVCSNWQLVDRKLGIFFIESNERLDDSYTMSVMLNGRELWTSPIRNLPQRGLNLPFESEFMYISSKVLRAEDIPYGDGILECLIFDAQNEEKAVAVLSIEDLREVDNSATDKAEEVMQPIEDLQYVAEDSQMEEVQTEDIQIQDIQATDEVQQIEELPQIVEAQQVAEVQQIEEIQSINEVQAIEELPQIVGAQQVAEVHPIEEVQAINEVQEIDEEVKQLIQEETYDSKEEVTESVEETLEYKTSLFKNISQYVPVNFHLDFVSEEEEYASLKKNIVIEKIGRFYITVLNDFQNRPVYFLYNGEQIVEWNDSFEEYILWMENIVGKMYNISLTEMKSIEKLVIVTNESEKIEDIPEENIKWIERKEAIENLSHKYNCIVDLNMDLCTIITKDEENKVRLNIASEGLAIKNFINKEDMISIAKKDGVDIEKIYCEWINCGKEILKPICKERILFLGYSAFPIIYAQLLEGFTMANDLPFVSLAWEI